jgi:hypothetical protein
MRFFKQLMASVLGVLIAGFAVEAVLRLARARFEGSVYEADAERGYRLRPHAAGWNTVENDSWIAINSDGMRDIERTPDRPPDTLRIAMLGASEIEGVTVAYPDSANQLMEHRLQRALTPFGKRVEVLNFGVAGYAASQFYLTLKNHIWKYSPQIVMLAVSGFEIIKNTRDLYPDPRPGTPFYTIKDGRLVPDSATLAEFHPDSRRLRVKNELSDLMNHSYLLSLINTAVRNALPGQLAQMRDRLRFGHSEAQTAWPPPDYLALWPYQPRLPATQQSWAIAEAAFAAMNEECRRHNAEFWLVILDEEMQSYPDAAKRAEFARRLGLPSLDESHRRLAQFCALHRIRIFNLAKPLGDYALAHHVAVRGWPGPRWGYGHWNERGHQVAAQIMTRNLLMNSPTLQHFTQDRSHSTLLARNSHELSLLASQAR